ncbi:hypothetical protein BN946_scf184796.g18 [Trametes cinnabarina]|uniref:Uncharacterized protein n=1 Tax=Pycnoporus cinnabarinus TaxID=5643 RepID=A0A060SWX0_PYCCI|nr:hypothetical protein BN946_scf184796.g18 [Trametes cinnabarina]
MRTMCELCTLVAGKKVPYFTPRNDWELLFLSTDNYKGPPSGFVDYIDDQFATSIDLKRQPHEKLMETARKILDEVVEPTARKILDEVVEPTGLKPELPDDPQVFVRPIPDSDYSICLFLGNAESRDYCLDFVRTASGEPVDLPFTFDLFCIPDPNALASTGGPIVSMRPLQCAFGIPRDEISPGTEKFLLRDGAHCVLQRPGHRDVRFTVPILRRQPRLPMQHVDAHILELPTYVD